MVRGKPWSVEEEEKLRSLVESRASIDVIAAQLERKPSAIYVKSKRLGIANISVTNFSVPLPRDLPSVEETLKKVAGALDLACTPGLTKTEVQRLQVIANLAKTYKEGIADYLNYRQVETKLIELEAKYAALIKETGSKEAAKGDATEPVSN